MSNFNTVIQLLLWIRGSKESSSLKSGPQVYSSCPFLVSTVHVFSILHVLTEISQGLNSLNYYIAPKVYSYGLKLMGCNYSSKTKRKTAE